MPNTKLLSTFLINLVALKTYIKDYPNRVILFKTALTYAEMIKLGHTLFALPFALSAVILAYRENYGINALQIFFIVVAFTAARSAAMGFNRIVDATFDAKNPRTKNRPITSGEISKNAALIFVILSSAIFFAAAYMLSFLCFVLAFPALAWIFFYSYTKRFTASAHLVLGMAIALAPLGAWVAITGGVNMGIVFLALASMTQICAFDLFYSMQDIDFDKEHKLFSIPSKFGLKFASRLAAICFLCSVIFLLGVKKEFDLDLVYTVCVGIIAFLYLCGLCVMKFYGLKKIGLVFFYMNVSISALVLVGILGDTFI